MVVEFVSILKFLQRIIAKKQPEAGLWNLEFSKVKELLRSYHSEIRFSEKIVHTRLVVLFMYESYFLFVCFFLWNYLFLSHTFLN